MATAQVSQNRVYLFRLQTLIIDGGTAVVRNIFDQKRPNVPLNIFLYNEKGTINRLRASKTITKTQFDLLYPQGGQPPTTNNFDLTLAICLLRNLKCCGLNQHFAWNVTPQPGDISLEADICRLKIFRNEISHISSTTGIQLATFQCKWIEIEQVLNRLNLLNPVQNLQQLINEYKNSPFDPEAEKKLLKEIKNWRKMEKGLETEIQLVKKDVQDVTKEAGDVKKEVGSVKEEVNVVKKNVAKEVEYVKEDVDSVKVEVNVVKKDVAKEVGRVKEDVDLVRKDVRKEVENMKKDVAKEFENVKKDVKDHMKAVQEQLETEKINQGTPKQARVTKTNSFKRFLGKLPFMRRQKKEETEASTVAHTQHSAAENEYLPMKNKLKDDLATFYTKRYSTIPLSPLFEKHDTPLVDFYILPEMNSIEIQKTLSRGEEAKTPVKSLSDVFKSGSSCETYLIADAGFGKTSFSKYLALTWCQAHSPERKYKRYFSEDVINTMREFEVLFLVLLRDSSDDCSIDDLILNHIVQNLSRSSTLTIDSLQEILHRERCLVILDGLDEWIHPEKKCAKVPKTIPHRNAREKCVILTTTRPWKLGVLNLKTSEIDKKVELVKLTSKSAQTLEERAISKIKDIDVAEAKHLAESLNKKIKENKLEDLESVPLLTMYLICLWCDEIPLGQSKCGLYASITELLLSRTIRKYPKMELTCEHSQSDIPQCFSEHEHCSKYCPYLKALGQLAFETLFSETKECTLVFNKSVADKFLIPDYLKLSLHSGLLTQNTETKLTKQSSKVSFSHKTVQEFFCALYISCQNETGIKKIFLKKCKSLRNILDMSIVFVFISGMVNAEIISSISREFMSVINEDKITSEYRSTTDRDCKPLRDIQDMYISCFKENTGDFKICCQDFFFSEGCKEEKYFTNLKRLAVHNENNMESININTLRGRSLREIIDCCALVNPFNINKIHNTGKGEEAQLPVLLDRSTKCVFVMSPGGSWTSEISKTLHNNSLLQAIYIAGFWMSHDILTDFLNYIINRKPMTEIGLVNLLCTEHGWSCTVSLDFCQHSDLRKLELYRIPEVSQLKVNSQVKHVELSGINLGERSLPPEMANIEHVVLSQVNMSASTFRDLVKVMEKLSHKVTVKIARCNIGPETEFEDVKQYIRLSQNFQVTDDECEFVFETKVGGQVTQ